MTTKKISESELQGKEVLAVGYKAVKYDGKTQQGNYSYGERGSEIVGTVHTVDGDIKECSWGLHFSKDPAYVFNFYKPLGYNRYFKVEAYDECVDSKDGRKSVAKTIKFVEEYDLMQFVDLIKNYDRSGISSSYGISFSEGISDSYGISYSYGISESYGISDSYGISESYGISDSYGISESRGISSSYGISFSEGISDSYGISSSYGISESYGISSSYGISFSYGISGSRGISYSYGVYKSEAVKNCIFCYEIECEKYRVFNKKVSKERFDEIYKNIKSFDYFPKYDNFYDLKGNKDWWALCFPELMKVDNATAWSKMPKEMDEYIRALPEFDEDIYKKITGNEENNHD